MTQSVGPSLADGEHRFRAIFDCSPDCIKLVDADGHLLDMNAAGLRMIGAHTLEDVRNKSLFDLIDPKFHQSFRKGVDAVFAGAITQMQFEVVGLDGRRLWMDQSAAPLFVGQNPDQVAQMLAITRDVTEERRSEADLLEARLTENLRRSAAAFAANLAEDLKSPLDNIIGYSELLKEAALEQSRPRDANDLQEVLNAAARLQSTLSQLLKVGFDDRGQRESSVDRTDIDELIDVVVEAARPLAEAKGNRISVEIDPQCASSACDHKKLGQCLRALIAHAVDATRNGTIIVKARRTLATDQPWLIFNVIDDGAGMTSQQLGALFQTSADLSKESPDATSSLALNLPAARKLATFLGGEIAATSAPGQGSRVTLKIPVIAPCSAEPTEVRVRTI